MTSEEALKITNDSLNKGKITEEMQDYRYFEAVKEAFEKADKSDRPKGKWEWSETERIGLSYGGTGYVPIVKCSHCDRITKLYLRDRKPTEFEINYPNFCPNCGADMTEE